MQYVRIIGNHIKATVAREPERYRDDVEIAMWQNVSEKAKGVSAPMLVKRYKALVRTDADAQRREQPTAKPPRK